MHYLTNRLRYSSRLKKIRTRNLKGSAWKLEYHVLLLVCLKQMHTLGQLESKCKPKSSENSYAIHTHHMYDANPSYKSNWSDAYYIPYRKQPIENFRWHCTWERTSTHWPRKYGIIQDSTLSSGNGSTDSTRFMKIKFHKKTWAFIFLLIPV